MKFLDFNKIIYRHILFIYLKNCLMYLLAISCIVLLFEYIELFRRHTLLIENGRSINPVVFIPMLNLPSFIYEFTPFVLFFASFTAYYKLNNDNELWILRAIGLNALKFISPALIVALGIGLFNFTFTSYIADHNILVKENIEEKAKTKQNIVIENNMFWAIEEQENNYKIAYATIKAGSNANNSDEVELEKIFLAEYSRKGNKLISSYIAKNGVYKNQTLTVYNAYKNNDDNKTYSIEPVMQVNMKQDFNKASLKQRNTEELSPYNLIMLGISSAKNKADFLQYFKILAFYVADIFFIANLAVTGAVLAFGLSRQQNIFILLGKAILVCFALYALYSIFISLGSSEIISTFNATFIPVVLVTLFNLILIFKKENGY